MAATLKPDPALQRFNTARDKMGHYFRFTRKSAVFNVVFMGLIPAAMTYYAYSLEGQLSFNRLFRDKVVLEQEYVPRKKDL